MDLKTLISQALAEDLGDGDHTSLACIPSSAQDVAILIAKENGVIAGLEVAVQVMQQVDASIQCQWYVQDGDLITSGQHLGKISGPSIGILSGERLMLNILQRMSGVATKTRQLADLIAPYNCKVLDTRKTTPLLRALEKQAVVIGGGTNHRIGLYDMMMIKDNHVDFAGGLDKAIQRCKAYCTDTGRDLEIIAEARNIEEVKAVLDQGGIKRILLDNFTPAQMTEAVQLVGDQCETEASGGITETTIVDYAKTGVDYISVGALTHSYKSLDLSLKAEKDL